MAAGIVRNSKLLDLCVIEIGVTVTYEIEVFLCRV